MPSAKNDILPALAIVGLSLKFPGDTTSEKSFWDLIQQGRCASTDFPADRLNIDAHYHPDSKRLDSLSARGGHFMKDDPKFFDAPFFSITAAEAEALDPQQRLVLETSYRALENAGITMDQVSGSKTCVFTGSFGHDYESMQLKDPQTLSKFTAMGVSMNMQSNRVSWFFNLVGPSATVDTACSSGLMAIDLACQSIWSGDSTMGMAIGSNVILTLDTGLFLDNIGVLSPESRCRSFDHRGVGYGRGEGVGVLVIKPVHDAIQDGDTIRAVIRASASNQDGRTPGITYPSTEMQETLIRDTYRKGGLDLADTRYFEAHGTGTSVGDPIESKAIGSVFRHARSNTEPLYIGSVKSNIGHLEGAAGLAGVIKAVLALENGVVPPNSENYEQLNPRIDDEFLHLKVLKEPITWPTDRLRRASVSSFGFGGSNSHVVLDDAYNFLRLRGLQGNHNSVALSRSGDQERPLHLDHEANRKEASDLQKLLVWSSADEKGVARTQETWESHFQADNLPDDRAQYLLDLSYTLGTRRTQLPWRSFVIARPSDDLSALTSKFSPASRALTSHNLALVFSGQGAQWYAMGRELLSAYPVFYQSMQSAEVYLLSLGCDWCVLDELQRPESESRVNQPEYSQTLCTALQVALVDLLRSWNVSSQAVVGHSSGEIAAAYAAQAVSQESAWRIAYFRGKLSGRLGAASGRKGTMLAVALSSEEAEPYIENIKSQHDCAWINIACVNSPKSVTISGDEALVEILQDQLDNSEVFSRKLKVGVAYHSMQMQEIAVEYQAALENLEAPKSADKTCPQMASSVTGKWIEPAELLSSEYWVQNMVSPVLFLDALSVLCSSSTEPPKKLDRSHLRNMPIHHILEVGPHSVMQGACKDTLKAMDKEKSTSYLSLLVRNVPAVDTALTAAGHLYSAGYSVNLSNVNLDHGRKPKTLSNLPEYSFDHSKSYWHESQLSRGIRLRNFARNDLLGTPDPNWNPLEARWRHFIRVTEMPWVEDHKVNGSILYPGMGMIVMAIEAAKQMAHSEKKIAGFNIKEADFLAAIRIPSNAHGIETGFYMHPLQSADAKSSGSFFFRLCTYENQTWTENCTGSIHIAYKRDDNKEPDEKDAEISRGLLNNYIDGYRAVQQATISPIMDASIYKLMAEGGLDFGEAFQRMSSLEWYREDKNRMIGKVNKFFQGPETIHPTTLDGIIQTGVVAKTMREKHMGATRVPTHVDKIWVDHEGLTQLSSSVLRTHATVSEDSQLGTSSNVVTFDEELQKVLVHVSGLRTNVVSEARSDDDAAATASQEQICHHPEWKPDLGLLSNSEITDLCVSKVEDWAELGTFFTELNFLLTARILQTLRQLPDKFPQRHFAKYIDWMMEQKWLFDQGQVQYAHEPWRSRLDNAEYIQQVEESVLSKNQRGNLTASVARNLPLFLSGELDPLAFLFEGDQMKQYYLEQLHDSDGAKRLGTYIDLLAHRNPQLRVLEIGAGTGSMTNIILQSLGRGDENSTERRYARWDYTDISRSFFGEAQDEFRQEGDRMRFSPLDIEQDPEGQGFEGGTYDVIVASLVLHATADIKKTLTNARKLLKKGGKIILNEITETQILHTPFVFGLLEGWWLSSEPYRNFGPCVEKSQWHELLQETGFSGLDVVLPDYEDARCHVNSLLISSAVEDTSFSRQPFGCIEIVYDPSEPEQAESARSLASLCNDLTSSAVYCVSVDQGLEGFSDDSSLRVCLLELSRPVLADIQPELFEKLKGLFSSTTDVLWVTSGGTLSPNPHFKLADGLFRVLMAEDDRKNCYLLALQDKDTNPTQKQTQIMKVVNLLSTSDTKDIDTDYVEHQGLLHIARLVSSTALNEQIATKTTPRQQKMQPFISSRVPLKLDVASSGLVPGFKFIEDTGAQQPLGPDEIEIEVKCAGVNFRDVLIAIGQLNSAYSGFEASGVVVRTGNACKKFQVGNRVAAMGKSCFANTFLSKETDSVVKIGPGISFADAAAIPVNFATAYTAIYDLARMRSGESILIHSAAGGTGQAAIQLAQNLGVTVYATVGSEDKRRFLMDVYNVPESHIFSSRSTLFADAIKARTNGRGVDAVFNSLAGDSLRASWECIAPYGRFLEIGIKDILANDSLPMRQFLRNVSFSAINLDAMMDDQPGRCAEALEQIYAMVEQGKLRPAQQLHTYGIGELEKAFRFMQSGKHIGKVVIEMRDDEVMTVLNTRPSTLLDPDATYVISGGLGGLGRNIALWLVDRGARNLVLLSRSGSKSPKAQQLTKELEQKNVRILTPSCDVADANSLAAALQACRSEVPPIRGCIQAAMVLRDALFESMPFASWSEALSPKVQGTWNLHQQLPCGLDFFIMLSSVSGILGTRGQANYAAGNTFQDALAAHRVSLGENATSLDLGYIAFTGALADDIELQERVAWKSVMRPVTESEIHALLDTHCSPDVQPSTCIPHHTTVRIDPNLENATPGSTDWLKKPIFRHLLSQNNSTGSTAAAAEGTTNVAALLAQAETISEANHVVIQALLTRLSKALSIPLTDIDADKPLHQYGVDSLVAVELRSWFAKEIQADIAVFDILGSATVTSVGQLATSKSRLTREKWVTE